MCLGDEVCVDERCVWVMRSVMVRDVLSDEVCVDERCVWVMRSVMVRDVFE